MKFLFLALIALLLSNFKIQKNQSFQIQTNVEQFCILDTIDFKGIMVYDEITPEIYFVERSNLNKITTKYNSFFKFKKDYKNKSKLNFLPTSTLKFLLKHYNKSNSRNKICLLHDPVLNGISVWSDKEKGDVFISFITGRLIKSRIDSTVVRNSEIAHFDSKEKAFYEFYSFNELQE